MVILVVDDLSDARRYLSNKLTRGGHVVFTAEDGQKACEIVKSTHIDVIISDVQMPVMDGIEFYNWILANQPKLASHFIFHSGSSEQLDRDENVREVRRIEKPFMGNLNQIVEAFGQ